MLLHKINCMDCGCEVWLKGVVGRVHCICGRVIDYNYEREIMTRS